MQPGPAGGHQEERNLEQEAGQMRWVARPGEDVEIDLTDAVLEVAGPVVQTAVGEVVVARPRTDRRFRLAALASALAVGLVAAVAVQPFGRSTGALLRGPVGTDSRTPGDLVDEDLVGTFLRTTHRHGLRIVGWYAPTLIDLDTDVNRLRAVAEFDADGHRFDGIAVDMEPTAGGLDPAARSARLVELSRELADLAREHQLPLAAIPPAPVHLEDVNPDLWPSFPWRELADLYDVWMPMSYWTVRSGPHRNAERFTAENLRRLRLNLGDPEAPVPALGGVGDAATEGEIEAFLRAAREAGALGASIYDYRSLSVGALAVLTAGVPAGGFPGILAQNGTLQE